MKYMLKVCRIPHQSSEGRNVNPVHDTICNKIHCTIQKNISLESMITASESLKGFWEGKKVILIFIKIRIRRALWNMRCITFLTSKWKILQSTYWSKTGFYSFSMRPVLYLVFFCLRFIKEKTSPVSPYYIKLVASCVLIQSELQQFSLQPIIILLPCSKQYYIQYRTRKKTTKHVLGKYRWGFKKRIGLQNVPLNTYWFQGCLEADLE